MAGLGQRYRMLEEIGRGGMSVVWRAHDDVFDRPVAIKVLHSAHAGDDVFRDRIRREARASARLAHPHVGVVHDFGQATDGLPYLVMELIDGHSLSDRLDEGRMPAAEAFTICAQIAEALAETHARGLVHRDVKPANVMLTRAGAKLVDFGISAVLGETGAPDVVESPLEDPYIVFGTPAYVAPELLTGHPAGTAADVYSLGVLLYELLTGHLPWLVETTTQLLRSHVMRTPLPLPPVAGVPREVISLSERCLSKDPANRPTCAELAAAWSAAAAAATTGGPAVVTRESPAPTAALFHRRPVAAARTVVGRHRRTVAVAAVVLGLLGFGLARMTGHPQVTAEAAALPAASAPLPACAVVYQLSTDDGHAFSGALTVQNTGPQPVPAGTLTFTYPSGQQIAGSAVTQHGDTVTVRTQALPAGATGRFAFTGRYDGVNAMPGGFALGQTACAARAVGITGQPVQVGAPDPQTKPGKANGPKPPAPKGKKP